MRFRSNLDDRECFGLFDSARGSRRRRPPQPMTGDVPELLQAGSDFRLVLERVWTGPARS
jgi:hypothetical protein